MEWHKAHRAPLERTIVKGPETINMVLLRSTSLGALKPNHFSGKASYTYRMRVNHSRSYDMPQINQTADLRRQGHSEQAK